jgi:hypothetical protein
MRPPIGTATPNCDHKSTSSQKQLENAREREVQRGASSELFGLLVRASTRRLQCESIFSKYDQSSARSVELKVHLYILFDPLMTIALRQEYSIDVGIPVSAGQEIASFHHEMGCGTRSIHPLLTTYRHGAVRPRFLYSSITLLQTAGDEGSR